MHKKTIFFYLFFSPMCCFSAQILTSNHEDGRRNFTPSFLYEACKIGSLDVVKFLVEQGEDPNAKGENGASPFQAACWKGHLEIVEYLLGKGADPNAPTDRGKGTTPLAAACYSGDLEVIRLLVNFKADINLEDEGATVLSESKTLEIAKYFVDLGVKVNEVDIKNSKNLEIKHFLQSKYKEQYGCVVL